MIGVAVIKVLWGEGGVGFRVKDIGSEYAVQIHGLGTRKKHQHLILLQPTFLQTQKVFS